MSQDATKNRHRTIAALALRDHADLDQLMKFAADDDAALCREMSERLMVSGGEDRATAAEEQLNTLMAGERFSGLAEIHPAWILEELRREPPRVIGVILRHLPSLHVRYILERLPEEVKHQLPDMIEVFSVPSPLLETIRQKFERHFMPMKLSRGIEHYGFNEIYYLKSEELTTLFQDLGIQEMAMALSSMSARTRRVLLNRLPLKDAKRLQKRMQALRCVSDSLRHQARFTVIGAAEERVGSKRMMMDIGLAAFSRSLGMGYEILFRYIQQKLKPELGYVLKRSLSEWADQEADVTLEERRQMIIERIQGLSKENAIDPSWARLFSAEDERNQVQESA